MNNDDVQCILIANQEMDSMPRNISSFFPNILSIELSQLNLTELSRDDINGFSKLKQMNLNPNNIQELGNDLFEGNPELEMLAFSNNPIRHIAHNVFDNLTKLRLVHMFLTCIGDFTDTPVGIENFKFQVSVRCPPTYKMIEKKILNGIEFQKKVDEKVAERINPLTWKMFEMGEKAIGHEERIKNLETLTRN